MMGYAKYLVDAHRPAQDAADKLTLPQTVFYHPDYAFSWIESGAKLLRQKQMELHVTWLPTNWWNDN